MTKEDAIKQAFESFWAKANYEGLNIEPALLDVLRGSCSLFFNNGFEQGEKFLNDQIFGNGQFDITI